MNQKTGFSTLPPVRGSLSYFLASAWGHYLAMERLCRRYNRTLPGLRSGCYGCAPTAEGVLRTFREEQLAAPGTILDIGANRGQQVRLLRFAWPGAFLASLEPNPALNPPGLRFQLGLSDVDGYGYFWMPGKDFHKAAVFTGRTAPGNSEKVEVARLDTLVRHDRLLWENLPRPMFAKIDVEGSEERVIRGFGTLMSGVDYVLVEVGGGAENLTKSVALLHNLGFDQAKVVYAPTWNGPGEPEFLDVLFWKDAVKPKGEIR